jgi:cellulose synthase (UDP-forming)
MLNVIDTKSRRQSIPAALPQQPRKSVSRQMYERFERRRLWRHFMSVMYVAVVFAYLSWRFTIINPNSLLLSVLYYAADCIGLILGVVAIITSWHYRHREPPPAPTGLSVDIFVPTYREPLHIIRRTAMAARAIEYPHGTFILDDGRRDEVRDIAAELGIRYLRRPENLHAKAGNLNFGLGHSRADFVAVFDADHIALPHALDLMLGFFSDPKVAMVQTPQDYYNIDAFQYFSAGRNKGLWHDQSFFYNIVQPSGDAVNAVSCVGTGVVYRRAALDCIGGIPVETVTEDMHTSLKLHKAGLACVYLNEPIAYGVAASDLKEYYRTRHRWAHGNLHVVSTENILFSKGLTVAQRFQYLALNLCYLEGWQQLMLFAVPILSLTLGLQPFKITILNVLAVMSFPFLSYLLLQEIGCGFTRYWANEIFSMVRWPTHIVSAAGLFRQRMVFRSSAKNIAGRVNWRLMAPQLAVAAASLGAAAIGVYRLHHNYKPGPLFRFLYEMIRTLRIPHIDLNAPLPSGYTIDLVAIAGFWAAYGAMRAGFFVRKAVQDACKSHEFFRFSVPLPVVIDGKGGGYGVTSRISEDWLSFTDCREGLREISSGVMDATLVLPAGPLPVKIAVENVSGREIEGRFVFDSDEQRDRLANGLYSVDWHREFLHRDAYFSTPSDLALACLGAGRRAAKRNPWQAALYQPQDDASAPSSYAIMSTLKSDGKTASIICFRELSPHSTIKGVMLSGGKWRQFHGIVTGREPLASLCPKGLDGAVVARYSCVLAVSAQ